MRTCARYTRYTPVLFGLFFVFVLPRIAHAQLIVPVDDADVAASVDSVDARMEMLNEAFKTYVQTFRNITFDDENSSLRALLSRNPDESNSSVLYLPGKYSNDGGRRSEDPVDPNNDDTEANACRRAAIADASNARPASSHSAWSVLLQRKLIDDAQGDFSNTEVNDSTSLSCLLQEEVEWNKLQLNLQIHTLLRDYLSKAQTTALAQRASGMIAKANLDWTKTGIKHEIKDADGNVISTESFSVLGTDPQRYTRSLEEARTRTIQERLLAASSSPNALQVCGGQGNATLFNTARELETEANELTSDPLASLGDQVACTAVNPDNPQAGVFSNTSKIDSFTSTDQTGSNQDPLDTMAWLMQNDQNTGPGLMFKLRNAQEEQLNDIQDESSLEYGANQGSLPVRVADPSDDTGGDPASSKIVEPGTMVGKMVTDYVQQQDDAIKNAKTAEDLAAVPKSDNDVASVQVLQQGLDNVDSSVLEPQQDPGKYIGDFVNAINSGYFDLQEGTKDWATGAMLNIYDATMLDERAYNQSKTLDPSDDGGDDVATDTATTTP